MILVLLAIAVVFFVLALAHVVGVVLGGGVAVGCALVILFIMVAGGAGRYRL